MLTDLMYRIRALFRHGKVEDWLDDELQFHLERQAEKHALAGMEPEAAMRKARMELGGLARVKEETRDSWGVRMLESIAQDVGYGLRALRKSPGFTVAVAASLALGIGANTAVYTLLNAVMQPVLPVKDPAALVTAGRTDDGEVVPGFTYGEYRSLRIANSGAQLAAYWTTPLQVSIDGPPEPSVRGQLVTGNYFALLGVSPVLGRAIGQDDDIRPNGHPVAMLSYEYWERRFGRDLSVLGGTIRISAVPFTIIGVTPPGFTGVETGTAPEVFLPIMMQPTAAPEYENLLENPIVSRWWVQMIARIRPGVPAQQAAAALDAAFQSQRAPGDKPDKTRIVLMPVNVMSGLRQRFSKPLLALLAMAGIVLLAACANVANLLLARAAARRPEFAMRLALGAGRARLMRQMLVESLLLAGLGGACGIALAHWGTGILVAMLSTGSVPIRLDLAPNLRVLLFTAGVSVTTGVLFGFAPAWRAARIDLTPALKHVRGAARGLRPGRVLSVAQLALSMTLLLAAGLFVRSLEKLNGADAEGLRQSIVIMRVEPKGSDQRGIPGTSERLDRLYQDLIRGVSEIPHVQAASMSNATPTSPTSSMMAVVNTRSGERLRVPNLMAYPNYFATMGIPIVRGRDFGTGDLGAAAAAVCIVNETYARRMYPGEDPLGKTCEKDTRPKLLTNAGSPRPEEPYTIVDVAQDSRYSNPRGVVRPLIYTPFLLTSTGRGQMALYARVVGSADGIVRRIREKVAAVDPAMPMLDVHTLEEEMDAALVQQRLVTLLAGFFGGLVLLLACAGLYGLVSFTSAERMPEMAIRMALGAGRASILWLGVREALALAAAGIAVGLPAAMAAARLASSAVTGLLFGVQTADPAAICGAAVLLAAVAMFAAFWPARRASRTDPNAVLRAE
jgi:predicted permease